GSSDSVYSARTADGGTEKLENLSSDETGVFWVGTLPYGVYYLNETAAPTNYENNKDRWFYLVVDENGAVVSSTSYADYDAAVQGYDTYKSTISS
ncbi:MAG: prealbumin-like fold domain-containing protein, partial [Coriobacteriales bacterium]|nr:prealbumin-like fold domain-containing protein [Coriobacteriales bacterium]